MTHDDATTTFVGEKVHPYLLVVEHGNDILGPASLHEYHLDDDSGLVRDQLASQHLATNGGHDTLNVCRGSTRSEITGNDAVWPCSAPDADFSVEGCLCLFALSS